MQKINIKKVTKEQMLKLLEEAAEKQEAAEAEAAAHFKDGVKLAEENEKLRREIGTLTEKLEENEKALEEVTAKYKSADHSAAILRSRIDEEKVLRDQALEVHGEDMKALEKAKNESRELAKQLGERMAELKAAEENARDCGRDEQRQGAAERGGDAREAQGRAAVRGAAHDQDREKHQGRLSRKPQVVHGASVAQRVALHERVFPLLTDKERERRGESDVPIQKERAGEL